MRRPFSCKAGLESKIARAIVATVAGALVIAVALWLSGEALRDREAAARAPARAADPLGVELVRCNGLDSAALDDAGCRSAWAENRRRFFGAPSANPSSVDAFGGQPLPQTSEVR